MLDRKIDSDKPVYLPITNPFFICKDYQSSE